MKETEEVLMRGPYVMLGYYNDIETTNKTIKKRLATQEIKEKLMMMDIYI